MGWPSLSTINIYQPEVTVITWKNLISITSSPTTTTAIDESSNPSKTLTSFANLWNEFKRDPAYRFTTDKLSLILCSVPIAGPSVSSMTLDPETGMETKRQAVFLLVPTEYLETPELLER